MRAGDCSGKFLRKLLVVLSVFFVVVLLSAYVSVRLYLARTYASQMDGIVLRCSEGIEVKGAEGDWAPLRPAEHLDEGMKIRTPELGKSFISFDGVRLLSAGSAEFEMNRSRSFSLKKGSVAVAAAKRKKPLTIVLGKSLVKTNDSTLRLSALDASFSIECIAGGAKLKMEDGAERHLAQGQAAAISEGNIQIAASRADNPFAISKVSVIDRIRKRFDRIISKYAYNLPGGSGRTHVGAASIYPGWGGNGDTFRFASYFEGDFFNLARAGYDGSAADYYETLFAPSNRTISIGRQRAIPLTPDYEASFPIWSHDGSMIAFTELSMYSWHARVRVARLDDLENSWDISQQYDTVLPFFPIAWAPDDRHVLFMVADHIDRNKWGMRWWWSGPYHVKIAPIDPTEGPVLDFDSPFSDIPLFLPLPVGKTISPVVENLPWGDAMLCGNWGNLAYIPIEPDGQSVANVRGWFLTDFNPREFFIMGGTWSASGSMIFFTAAENLDFDSLNAYILYDVEDILDGFTPPPRSPADPRLKRVAPSANPQLPSNFSYDESLVFFQEDVNDAWRAIDPTNMLYCDFDLFYADARPDQPSRYTQIHLPGNQLFMRLSPEGNRLAHYDYGRERYELKVTRLDSEADMDMDLGGVLIDNSGTNLIAPPGALEENFNVKISTPFLIEDEAEPTEGENTFFAMRLLDAQGLENPKFVEPMTLTIRYTDEEVKGFDEGMLEIYHYDESNPENPVWIPLGGTVDPENNEITVEIRHFSKFSVGGKTAPKK